MPVSFFLMALMFKELSPIGAQKESQRAMTF
jgi:hypothetical protein